MSNTGQKISEFIIRGESFIANETINVLNREEDGEDSFDLIKKVEGIFRFLIELQSPSNQWTDRQILKYIDEITK